MAENKIRKDKHGLYVIENDYVYRPCHTSITYNNYGHVAPDMTANTKFSHTEKIRIVQISETHIASIRNKNSSYRETWFLHGKKGQRSSSLCWNPFH